MIKEGSAPSLSKGILKLARQINAKAAPTFVAVEPGADCLPGKCFENVLDTVNRYGGAVQHGWSIREQATAYVVGEFHAVWRRHDDILIDVTPRTDGKNEILFLPDPKLVWTGDVVEPQRMMLNLQPCYCGSGMPFKICHGVADD